MNIIQLVFLLLFVCSSFKCVAEANGIGNNTNNIMCVEEDRQALFKFKHKITYDSCGLLSTWTEDSQNCCQWHGVRCDNNTGRVIKLSLRGVDDEYEFYDSYTWDHLRCLEGRVSSSVVALKHLTYLDLSLNNFSYQPIPTFIGSLVNLKYLNLSYSVFEGEIPHHLGNLSSLISLDLSRNSWKLYVNDLSWLSRLTRLTSLNLSYVDLSRATSWSQIINNLPFLRILRLDGCELSSPVIPRPLSFKNSSTTIQHLSLHWNNLNDSSIVFEWLFNLSGINTHLAHLDLSDNQLGGPLPSAFGNLHSLTHLDLSDNQFQGLILLNLSSNNLSGSITPKVGQLTSLEVLDVSNNKLSGEIPTSLAQLNSLGILDLSNNNLSGEIPNIPQLQRFDNISYMGNPKLCGIPLPNCPWDQPPHNNEPTNEVNANHEDDSNATFLIGLYISVVLGFIIGFWGVCGSLVLKRTWRQAFFRFFEDMGDKFHAKVYLKMARLWRRQ